MAKLKSCNPHKWMSLLLSPQVDKLQNPQCEQIKIIKSIQVDKFIVKSANEQVYYKVQKVDELRL